LSLKVQAQNDAGKELQGHFEKIKEYNQHLQAAISVASYAVGLEGLENALNATKMLISLRMQYVLAAIHSMSLFLFVQVIPLEASLNRDFQQLDCCLDA
jgi:hypothetical protein